MNTGRLLIILGAAAPLCLPLAWGWSHAAGWTLLAVMAGSHAVLLQATLRPNRRTFGPITTGFAPSQGNEVWLTIDDGPDPADTPRVLDVLDDHGAQATFFVRGDRAHAHPDLIAEIVRRGHGLGNHTYSHPQATFWCLGPGRLRRELGGCNAVLRELTGQPPRLFRAPVGMVNPFVHGAAAACGLRLVGWSARGFDGVDAQAADPCRRRAADHENAAARRHRAVARGPPWSEGRGGQRPGPAKTAGGTDRAGMARGGAAGGGV